ncbi:ribosome biogenesis GTPase Der [candidate division KSB1 bacterium]|nr:ribosome biogenesis GTPase Der [candidate division KSB1 bacterium]
MNNTVAIVGRPNVGKSTLFNRILRKREAIVDDAPGVTRDRIYAQTEWAGVEFQLIDTGGYVHGSIDVFEQGIREQVVYALHEADVVVFLVDVTTGITPLDEEVAELLQRSNSKVVLGVNKVDNQEREGGLYEFYRLGLGTPYPISAQNSRAVGDFLDAIIEKLPRKESGNPTEQSFLSLAVLGRPNVGKSSYVNAILGESRLMVTDIAGTTRDAIDTEFPYKQRRITLIDTAGLRKRSRVHENVEFYSTVRTMNAIRRCDVALVLIDAVAGVTDQDKKIIGNCVEERKGIVIGVNKWDLVERQTNTARDFERDLAEEIRDVHYIPVFFISALTRQRIFKVLDTAVAVFDERNRKIATSELNQFLQDAVHDNQPPPYGAKYVKLNYMVQTRTAPPVFTFFTNEPKGIPKNYRNYLENRLRTRFGFFGVPISLRFRKKN